VPRLLVKQDGTAELDFRTYSFRSTSCWTLTVVVHGGPDNLGHLSSRYLSGTC
jgi:Cu/Zn superoxide dismutase